MPSCLLYVVGHLRTGGLQRQLCYLLQAMNRDRYQPAVVVWNDNESSHYVRHIRSLGVPVYFLSGICSAGRKLRAFRGLVRHLDPQVVHSYSFYTNFAAWWATRLTEIVAIGSVRSDLAWAKNEIGPWLARLSGRWPRDQVCNSWLAAKTAQCSRSPFVPKRLHIIPNGIDLERFHSLPFPAHSIPMILGLGSLEPVKRWDRLITAALELKRHKLDFRVKIIGDGSLRRSLQQLINDFRVQDHVELGGYTEDVLVPLGHAAFLVHTSDAEGCPNAIMEAMACGRSVIATDVGDVSRLVDDGVTGYVVRLGEDATLVQRIVKLITERELCIRMGEAGRAKAEREFRLECLVSRTLAAYRVAGWKDPDDQSSNGETSRWPVLSMESNHA